MSKFRKKEKREVPQPPSGSLSDIVFMLLFFFMVTTTMRDKDAMVDTVLPEATEIEKLERKDLTSTISIGKPLPQYQNLHGTGTKIQMNDSFKKLEELRDFIDAERKGKTSEDQKLMTVAIKADKDIKMGIVTEIKQELRRCSALRIMYVASEEQNR